MKATSGRARAGGAAQVGLDDANVVELSRALDSVTYCGNHIFEVARGVREQEVDWARADPGCVEKWTSHSRSAIGRQE